MLIVEVTLRRKNDKGTVDIIRQVFDAKNGWQWQTLDQPIFDGDEALVGLELTPRWIQLKQAVNAAAQGHMARACPPLGRELADEQRQPAPVAAAPDVQAAARKWLESQAWTSVTIRDAFCAGAEWAQRINES